MYKNIFCVSDQLDGFLGNFEKYFCRVVVYIKSVCIFVMLSITEIYTDMNNAGTLTVGIIKARVCGMWHDKVEIVLPYFTADGEEIGTKTILAFNQNFGDKDNSERFIKSKACQTILKAMIKCQSVYED